MYRVRTAGNCRSCLRLSDGRRRHDAAVLAGHAIGASRRRRRRRRRSQEGGSSVSSSTQAGARRLKDADVDNGHNRERDVEGTGSAVHDEAGVVGQLALLGLGVVQRMLAASAAVPADQGRDRDDGARRPDDGYLHEDAAPGSLHRVRDRVVDGVVAIERDGAQVQDRRRARQNVERQPRVAPDSAERPSALDKTGHVERHHEHGDRQIGAGQRRDEEVWNCLERRVREDGQYDENVAEDRRSDQRRQYHRVSDHLYRRQDVRRRRPVRQISNSVRVRGDNGRLHVGHRIHRVLVDCSASSN